MNKGVVIVCEEKGIFVGHALGLAFWSKLDAVGQLKAPTFDAEEAAKNFASDMQMLPEEMGTLRYVEVATADEFYASIEELVTAGLAADLGNLGEELSSAGMTLH